MDFENKLPEWQNEGTEPSEKLKTGGFPAKYKPPASIMNWLFSAFSKAITELQNKMGNINADEIDCAEKDLSNVDEVAFKNKAVNSGTVFPATSTDGVTYTVTLDDITEIYNGMEFVIIPNTLSNTTTPKLNIVTQSGTVTKTLTLGTTQNTRLIEQPENLDFIGSSAPIRIKIFGDYAIIDGYQKVRATNIRGTMPINKGGTGATTVEQARANLGFATTRTCTATVSAIQWAYADSYGGYTMSTYANGILATDNPIVDVVLGDSADDNRAILEAWECVSRIKTFDGVIKLYANDKKPAVDFTIQLKAVR